MTAIAKAVEHLRKPAMARAEVFATKQAERVYTMLAKFDWDADIVAPYPKSGFQSRKDYMVAKGKYSFYRQLTTQDRERTPYCRRRDEPEYVIRNEVAFEKFVAEARQNASLQYDAFVAKLESKCGPVLGASLKGSHVWGYSLLTVITEAGETQVWKTRMILNVSKLGKVFNQWPTRQVKR